MATADVTRKRPCGGSLFQCQGRRDLPPCPPRSARAKCRARRRQGRRGSTTLGRSLPERCPWGTAARPGAAALSALQGGAADREPLAFGQRRRCLASLPLRDGLMNRRWLSPGFILSFFFFFFLMEIRVTIFCSQSLRKSERLPSTSQ